MPPYRQHSSLFYHGDFGLSRLIFHFYAACLRRVFFVVVPMNVSVTVALVLITAFAVLLLWREGYGRKKKVFLLAAAVVVAAMLLRWTMLRHVTLDYRYFLSEWVAHFRKNGGFSALSVSIGNYNVPYLYFLALFSYSKVRDLFLIKLLSIFFDVVLAWAVLRLTRAAGASDSAALCAYVSALLLPTVLLNGAYWGQCDSIYAAFALMSIAMALERRPVLAMVSAALSFAFKLQAVFLLPVFLIFLFTGHIRWKHLAVFPLTYLIVVLPAVIAGRPLLDTVLLYFDQAGSVGSALNYNSSSVFALVPVPSGREEAASSLGIIASAEFLVVIYLWAFRKRKALDARRLLGLTLLISLGVPYFLPHMHDRYFYLADVLSLAVAVTAPEMLLVPVLVSFGSFLGYYAYLNMRFLLPLRYGAAAMLLALCATAVWSIAPRPGGGESEAGE